MSLKNWSLAAITAMLVAPLSASALGIVIESVSSTGASTSLLQVGDELTFNLRLENPGNLDVFGLGIGAYGYDEGAVGSAADNHLQFVGGSSSDQAFATGGVVIPTVGAFNNGDGLANSATTATEQGAPFPFNQERRATLFNGVATLAANGGGNDDVGIGGGLTGPGGDVHISVTFRAGDAGGTNAPGVPVNLEFGTGQFGNEAVGQGGAILAFANANYTVTVIPEPGTALLMGLGLAGLAGTRRR